MQKRFWISVVFVCYSVLCAAQNEGCFYDLNLALQNKEQVKSLDLKKQKLDTFPMEILEFENLERLDLSRNNIKSIPVEISRLEKLHYLNLAQNYLHFLPKEVALLPLDTLILWDNMIRSFDVQFSNLKLKYLDIRAIQMTRKEQKAIKLLFPNTRIRKDHPCNCGSKKE